MNGEKFKNCQPGTGAEKYRGMVSNTKTGNDKGDDADDDADDDDFDDRKDMHELGSNRAE